MPTPPRLPSKIRTRNHEPRKRRYHVLTESAVRRLGRRWRPGLLARSVGTGRPKHVSSEKRELARESTRKIRIAELSLLVLETRPSIYRTDPNVGRRTKMVLVETCAFSAQKIRAPRSFI